MSEKYLIAKISEVYNLDLENTEKCVKAILEPENTKEENERVLISLLNSVEKRGNEYPSLKFFKNLVESVCKKFFLFASEKYQVDLSNTEISFYEGLYSVKAVKNHTFFTPLTEESYSLRINPRFCSEAILRKHLPREVGMIICWKKKIDDIKGGKWEKVVEKLGGYSGYILPEIFSERFRYTDNRGRFCHVDKKVHQLIQQGKVFKTLEGSRITKNSPFVEL